MPKPTSKPKKNGHAKPNGHGWKETTAPFTSSDLAWLRNVRLFVATPMYSMGCTGEFRMASLILNTTLIKYGITHTYSQRADSLVPRARNWLADRFLAQDFTHFLAWDADVVMSPEDVVRMLVLSRRHDGILCGPYAKKTINWERIAKAARDRKHTWPIEDMPAVGTNFVLNFIPSGTAKQSTISLAEPQEILEGGTGWMLIPRHVFTDMIDQQKVQSWRLMPEEIPDYGNKVHAYAFFQALVDPTTEYYLSEDWYFCRLWRSMGGKVWACLWMKSQHIGHYAYPANLPVLSRASGGVLE